MEFIKSLDRTLAIKMRGIYGRLFNPTQPQFTINCEKDKDVIQKMIYERIVGGQPLMVARMGRTEIDVCENVKYTFFKKRFSIDNCHNKEEDKIFAPNNKPVFGNKML